MHRLVRIAVVALAVAAVFGMGVYYGSVERQHWPYPHEDELATNYGDYTGERALLFGTVESVDRAEGVARITVDADPEPYTMTVERFDAPVEPGGAVQVLGTLRSDRSMTAERTVVVNPDGRSAPYKYLVSAVGALVVLAVFFRRWRVDGESLAFAPR